MREHPLNRTRQVLLVALILALGACATGETTGPGTEAVAENVQEHGTPLGAETRAEYGRALDRAWETIGEKYWDPALGGLDWEAARKEAHADLAQADTEEEAQAVMQSLVGRLGVSHMAVIPMEDDADVAIGGVGAGFDLRVLDGQAVVTRVRPGGPADQAGVRAGWILTAIDGRSFRKRLARKMKALEKSTGRDLVLHETVMDRVTGPAGTTVRLACLDAQGEARELELERRAPEGPEASVGHLMTGPVEFESGWCAEGVGYIRFSMFMDPPRIMASFARAVQGFMSAKGIIIDLRGNPGGIGTMSCGMSGWFVDQDDLYLGKMKMRDSELRFTIFPRPETFSGPLAVLVDGCSASTSEIMAAGLKDLGRARIFGSRTAGMALPSAIEKLPNGDLLQYVIADYVSRNGQALEGKGVTPDEEIRLDRASLLAGRDAVKQAAIEWIRKGETHSRHSHR